MSLDIISKFFIVSILMSSCFIGAGTHGSLQGYEYPITKIKLEQSIKKVIEKNSRIYIDTIGIMIVSPKHGGGKDTIYDQGYNDGKKYITIKTKTDKGLSEFTFRFYGDEVYWNSSKTSEIFLAYAFDKNGKGGSEGLGFDKKETRNLIELFESEVILNLDKELKLKHIKTK